MANLQDCTFLEATICSGYSGTSPIWVNKAMIPGRRQATGCAFAYNGNCYSLPVNPQPATPPVGALYVRWVETGSIQLICSECCACTLSPPNLESTGLCFQPSASATVNLTITGGAGCAFAVAWDVTWITINGSASPYNSTVGSGGSTTLAVAFDGSQSSGSTSLAFTGCVTETVTVEIGGASCTGTQPTLVTLTDSSDLQAVTNSLDWCPNNCGACIAGQLFSLPENGSCEYLYFTPPSYSAYSLGGVTFNAQTGFGIVFESSSQPSMWELTIEGACTSIAYRFFKYCGSDPTGRYYWWNADGSVDYSHYIDVQ